MTEPDPPTPAPAPATPDRMPERIQITADHAERRSLAPLAYVAGLVVLCVALYVLWRYPANGPQIAQDATRLDTIERQVHDLGDRIAALEARPASPRIDLGPFEARLAQLEQRPAPAASAPVDLSALTGRIDAIAARQDALVNRQTADAQAIGSKLDTTAAALSGKIDANAAALNAKVDTSVADLNARAEASVTALTTRVDTATSTLTSKVDTAMAALDGKTSAVDGRIGAIERQQGQVAGLAARSQLLSRLQSATVSLELGQKLGDIPGAPPALARYASDPPPTEASLRLAYPAAADAARRASQPAITERQGFFGRAWTRAQQNVDLREGDRVIVGDPISGVLTHAQQTLDAGDLAGAVKVLDQLAGPARAAMGDWLDRAQGLIAARSALAALSAQG